MKYIIVVDKQSRTDPSTEKQETTIEIEELRRKGNVHDDFVIEKGIAKVYRRLGLTKTLVTYILDNEVIEELGELKIKLFEGDNYIYIEDEYNNQMCAEFVIKNDFTDSYVTNLQMESAIEETASTIKLYVSQSLEGYSNTEQTKAMIQLKADEIKEEVSNAYATKEGLEQERSERIQKANEITQTVSKKVGNDEIISKINQSAEKVVIKADKIDIDGKAVRFKTNVSGTLGPFTQADKQKVTNHILGTAKLTGQEFTKYDLNNDGEINTYELAIITRAIVNGGYYTFSGTYEINPYSINKSIVLYDNRGFYQSIISLMYNYFNSLYVGQLETKVAEDKTWSQMSSGTINIIQDDTSNSIWLQVNTEIDNKSATEISLMHGNSSKNGSIDLVTQEDNSYISLSAKGKNTTVSVDGITTPKLTQTSLKSKKKNIKKLKVNATELIKNSDICLYNLKGEKTKSKKHIGLVIGDGYNCPKEVISEDGQGVEQYSMTSLAWKAIQELIEENNNLKQRIEKLEAR